MCAVLIKHTAERIKKIVADYGLRPITDCLRSIAHNSSLQNWQWTFDLSRHNLRVMDFVIINNELLFTLVHMDFVVMYSKCKFKSFLSNYIGK